MSNYNRRLVTAAEDNVANEPLKVEKPLLDSACEMD